MSLFLTAVEVAPVKVWNLVDWVILHFGLSVNASIAANIIGALFCMAAAFLLGSISPAVLISRHVCGEDIRTLHRETATTYNMLLCYGRKMAIITALCEFFIAYAAVWFGRFIWESNGAGLALFFVVIGNLFPVFHRFHGGKGIVTMIGAAAALHPITALLLIIVFALAVIASKLVAFGAVAITLLYALFIKSFANDGLQLAMAVFVTAFVLIAHLREFRRVQEGQEEKFYISEYLKKKKAEDADDE